MPAFFVIVNAHIHVFRAYIKYALRLITFLSGLIIELSHPFQRCYCLKYRYFIRIVNVRQPLPILWYEKIIAKNAAPCSSPPIFEGRGQGWGIATKSNIADNQWHATPPQPLPLVKGRGAVRTNFFLPFFSALALFPSFFLAFYYFFPSEAFFYLLLLKRRFDKASPL